MGVQQGNFAVNSLSCALFCYLWSVSVGLSAVVSASSTAPCRCLGDEHGCTKNSLFPPLQGASDDTQHTGPSMCCKI